MKSWFDSLFKVWCREFYLVATDAGVLIFFLALPLLYPVVYTLIYNPEVVREIPIAIVDNSRTPQSRQLARMLDATPSANVIGYAASKSEARQWYDSKDCYAVIEIPDDYAAHIGSGEQAVVNFYCDMSLLIRYRAMLLDFTTLQIDLDSQLRTQTIDMLGTVGQEAMGTTKAVGSNGVFIGDTSQGFASFVMPGIFVLILQQSLILGVTMLAGGRSERRRRNGGNDPMALPDISRTATVFGRTLCYITIYLPLTLYMMLCMPTFFNLPDCGNIWEYLLLLLPMLIAASMMGQTVSIFVREREASMIVIVFTSVVYLFLSGLTWPVYAMSSFWKIVGGLIPSTWGVQSFIHMASNGATLADQSGHYLIMWGLAAFYTITAILTAVPRRSAKAAQASQKIAD